MRRCKRPTWAIYYDGMHVDATGFHVRTRRVAEAASHPPFFAPDERDVPATDMCFNHVAAT